MVCERDVETSLRRDLDPIEKSYLETVNAIRQKEAGQWKSLGPVSIKESGSNVRVTAIYRKESGSWELYYVDLPVDAIGWYDGDLSTAPEYEICDGTNGNPNLIDSFARGASSQGVRQGLDSHNDESHAGFNTGYTAPSSVNNHGTSTGNEIGNHYHAIGAHNHGSVDHIPEYLALQPVLTNGRVRAGLVLWYRGSSAPTGWSARADANGKYLRGKTGAGTATGGAASHSHPSASPSCSYAAPRYIASGAHNNDGADYRHTHTTAHTSEGDNNPAHIELMAIEASADGAQPPSGAVAMCKGSRVPHGWKLCDGSDGAPDYMDVMVKCNNSGYNDTVQGSDTHADESAATYTGYTTSSQDSTWGSSGNDTSERASHRHYMAAHNHGAANNNLPVHTPILLIIKS